jgi:hypothetical protein
MLFQGFATKPMRGRESEGEREGRKEREKERKRQREGKR